MTTASPGAVPAAAAPLTFAANPGGGFPSVLTEDGGRVTAPAGGAPMRVVHRYEDLLSVKSSPAWRMANRCETPLTGAEIPGGDPPGHMLGMDGAPHRKLRRTIGHLFTSHAADALRPQMRKTAAGLLDHLAVQGTGDLRADYAEPATAATVCAALGIPAADWAPVIRPAGEAAFGVVHPGGGLAASRAAWDRIWAYYRRVIATKRASPDGGLVAQMHLAMKQAGYTTEEIVRAVATVSNGATALLPVLERVLLWLLQRPGTVAEVFLGERTWPQLVREAMVQGAVFPVTPPLVAGQDARIGGHPVPEGTLVLPSLVSAVHHPRGGAWLAFGPGQHRCPGDELTLAAVAEYAGAFFRRYPCACLTTPVLAWRDGPLAVPREARFAVRRLCRAGTMAALPGASLLRLRPRRSTRVDRAAGGLPQACRHVVAHGDVRKMRLPSDDLVWDLCLGHRAPSRWRPCIAARCRRSTVTCCRGAVARWWPRT
jgi:cytochrome P450